MADNINIPNAAADAAANEKMCFAPVRFDYHAKDDGTTDICMTITVPNEHVACVANLMVMGLPLAAKAAGGDGMFISGPPANGGNAGQS